MLKYFSDSSVYILRTEEVGLKGRKPVIAKKKNNMAAQFRLHLNQTLDFWNNVFLLDKTKVQMFRHNRQLYVW